jgi:hypothetical protein
MLPNSSLIFASFQRAWPTGASIKCVLNLAYLQYVADVYSNQASRC